MRSYEAFKYLHVGMLSDLKRKSLPEIARIVGLSNEPGLLLNVFTVASRYSEFYHPDIETEEGVFA